MTAPGRPDESYPYPRWAALYPVLPLAIGLLWLIGRTQASGGARSIMDIGVLLAVAVYVELWRLANRLALLHHPRGLYDGAPIYYVQDVFESRQTVSEEGISVLFVTGASFEPDVN